MDHNEYGLDFYLSILATCLLLLGLAHMPYGYYTFLRIVVCLSSIYFLKHHYPKKMPISIIFGLMAILYNPIIPIHLSRDVWAFLNLGSIGFFVFNYIKTLEK